jgi:hypothetical protein
VTNGANVWVVAVGNFGRLGSLADGDGDENDITSWEVGTNIDSTSDDLSKDYSLSWI